jgi:hypothetical protein
MSAFKFIIAIILLLVVINQLPNKQGFINAISGNINNANNIPSALGTQVQQSISSDISLPFWVLVIIIIIILVT